MEIQYRYTAIPKAQYDDLMNEIQAMKPSKRKNWKSSMTDKYGTRSNCKYKNNRIYNYNSRTRKWQEVVVLESMHKHRSVALSRLGKMVRAGVPFGLAFQLETLLNTGKST